MQTFSLSSLTVSSIFVFKNAFVSSAWMNKSFADIPDRLKIMLRLVYLRFGSCSYADVQTRTGDLHRLKVKSAPEIELTD